LNQPLSTQIVIIVVAVLNVFVAYTNRQAQGFLTKSRWQRVSRSNRMRIRLIVSGEAYMPEGMLRIKAKQECRWDILSLGEVMLRFDPGDKRIVQARQFDVWEGGGEYNVARGLSRCFGQRATAVTALVDNPMGRLIESLMLQGGVDASHVLWREYDGIGQAARNGIYFLERGFGVRSALGSMDRGHTAISQLKPEDIDWEQIFGREGVRWFHTGGIFCSLSERMPQLAHKAMETARKYGSVVSFDCNYRPSLWKTRGGRQGAARVNRDLLPFVDVLFGHEGDIALELIESSLTPPTHTAESFAAMAKRVKQTVTDLKILVSSTRRARTANRNDWGGFAYGQGEVHRAVEMSELEILDRVGGGDAFAAGFIFGLLTEKGLDWALNCGVAHGALAMTTPGDNSFATLEDVTGLMTGVGAGVKR
jgi:2-dehydro-3-deoxygluconokinase